MWDPVKSTLKNHSIKKNLTNLIKVIILYNCFYKTCFGNYLTCQGSHKQLEIRKTFNLQIDKLTITNLWSYFWTSFHKCTNPKTVQLYGTVKSHQGRGGGGGI